MLWIMYSGEAGQVLTWLRVILAPCQCAGRPLSRALGDIRDLLTFITLVTRLNQSQASEQGRGGRPGEQFTFCLCI